MAKLLQTQAQVIEVKVRDPRDFHGNPCYPNLKIYRGGDDGNGNIYMKPMRMSDDYPIKATDWEEQ
jgi:hypothetical protein